MTIPLQTIPPAIEQTFHALIKGLGIIVGLHIQTHWTLPCWVKLTDVSGTPNHTCLEEPSIQAPVLWPYVKAMRLHLDQASP